MHLKMSSSNQQPLWSGFNMLTLTYTTYCTDFLCLPWHHICTQVVRVPGCGLLVIQLHFLSYKRNNVIEDFMWESYIMLMVSVAQGMRAYGNIHKLNVLRPERNGWHLADIFNVFCWKNVCILIQISLKFVYKGLIDNKLLIKYITTCHFLNKCWLTVRGVTIHLVTIRFVLWYTACDTLNDTIFAIHISDILFIQEL